MRSLTLRELIIIHVNYRDVFNASVNLYDLQSWVGVTESLQLISELDELMTEGLIETDGELNYCVTGRSALFEHKASKKRLSERSLKNHKKIVHYLSWMPFIRFVGVSGSIAAENATIERTGFRKGSVDLDIFIITSSNSLWLVFYFERLLTNLFVLFLKGRYLLCFNYAMDATFQEIHNKNMYTATELYNLKTLYSKNNALQHLLKLNAWAEKYYPSLGTTSYERGPKSAITLLKEVFSVFIYPLNFSAFVLFQLSRCLKNASFAPLNEIRLRFSAGQRNNLKRICNPYGGYEELIKDQFERKFKENFSSYFKPELMEFLFPVQHFDERDVIVDPALTKIFQEFFAKYNITSPQ